MRTKISIDAIEVIEAVVEKGSFAGAANYLHRVPSAITYSIKKIEEDLGIIIFDRSGHRARLTTAGLELLNEGRRLINAATEIEARVKRVASGIETHLTIAVCDLIQAHALYQVLHDFYAENFGTRIKLITEVFGGCWDALTTGRADISVCAPGDGPSGGGYSQKLIGNIDFVFAVAPFHPLATIDTPLKNHEIMQYRSVSVADSSRYLAPRTAGILDGQDVLTLAVMQEKIQAQIQGLGIGYLPKPSAEHYAKLGLLVIKETEEVRAMAPAYLAWRTQLGPHGGKAQQWLLERLMTMPLAFVI